jgi:hypothetical protein
LILNLTSSKCVRFPNGLRHANVTSSLDFSLSGKSSYEHHRVARVGSFDVVRAAQHMVELGDQLGGLVQVACTKRIGEENTLLLADALQQFDDIARDLRALAPRIARALAA